MKRLLLSGVAAIVLPGAAMAACPAVTVADAQGVAGGEHPQQYDLAEFQSAANCTLEFSENPAIGDLNAKIKGNGDLPAVADRLPTEPLIVVPYDAIGQYGGQFNALSNATESGTSDFLSVRHTGLVRYLDDLQTIVPHVAKSYEWNDTFDQLTVTLREGHKWSDGAPFTSADVVFWYNNLMMDPNVIPEPKGYALAGEQPMEVVALDEKTVQFNMKAPKPGLIETFAVQYVQPYQPAHFLGQFHPEISDDADAKAQALGYENGYDLIKAYYGNSDWTDTPSPMLTAGERLGGLPKNTVPTLESHILVGETAEGRQLVANPYFFAVDTAGNQLPYINEQNEVYISDEEVRVLKLLNGEVTYKAQSVGLPSAPVLLEGQETGGYRIDVKPTVAMPAVAFNMTHEDEAVREVFNDLRFRTAMSNAINRDEINETVFFGLGAPQQHIGFSPVPDFVDPKWTTHETQFDIDRAGALLDEIGLVDADGDGFRDLPNGDPFVLDWQFSTQEVSSPLIELIAQNWIDAGINTTIKEVTPDEYRSAQSANSLDVLTWTVGRPAGTTLGDNTLWVPPYSDYFGLRPAMGWAEWLASEGSAGVEPPEFAMSMIDDIAAFQASIPGTAEHAEIGSRMVETLAGNLLFIGIISAPSPIYFSSKLSNVPEFKTASYEFYRTYPYRAFQWSLSE